MLCVVSATHNLYSLYKGNNMSNEFETTTEQRIQPNLALQEPPLYKVVYLNDEVTTMEFVVDSLNKSSTPVTKELPVLKVIIAAFLVFFIPSFK